MPCTAEISGAVSCPKRTQSFVHSLVVEIKPNGHREISQSHMAMMAIRGSRMGME